MFYPCSIRAPFVFYPCSIRCSIRTLSVHQHSRELQWQVLQRGNGSDSEYFLRACYRRGFLQRRHSKRATINEHHLLRSAYPGYGIAPPQLKSQILSVFSKSNMESMSSPGGIYEPISNAGLFKWWNECARSNRDVVSLVVDV